MPGKVYIVGAGPGAPDLITVRGAAVLARADIVFYDALVHPGTLAHAPARAERIAVGKRCGRHSTAQRFINKRLVDAASRHETVVRLKGGDPSIFGRLQEEADALHEAGIGFEIIPGVTAATAAAAELGVALTQRGVSRNVVFVTPRVGADEDASDWAASVTGADTAVIYMGAGQAAAIARHLMSRGLAADTPAAIIENATLPAQRHWTLSLAELPLAETFGITGPALILLGEAMLQVREAVHPRAGMVRSA